LLAQSLKKIMLSLHLRLTRPWRLGLVSIFGPVVLFFIIDAIAPVNLNPKPGSRVILAGDKTPLRAFADNTGVWRYPITINDVSPLYLEALVNYEDRFFYRHPGVNPLALARALGQAIQQGEVISGGSTLTMQVARMRYPETRNLFGKFKEIIRALQLELHFSKQDILTYYLNHAPFGGTIEGTQAAALAYFGYGADDLTHAQAALLAVLPQAPTRYRPDRNSERATQARNKVIDRLVTYGVWSLETATDAKTETVRPMPISRYNTAPLLARRLAKEQSISVIQSSINKSWQSNTEQMIKSYVKSIGEHVSAATLVMENSTGLVRIYVGSSDFNSQTRFGHVDMVQATRSPGSTLKPFIYGLALDEGLLHSESLLMNVPLKFSDYQPENFSGGFSGPVSVSYSLATSLNVPAVQVLEQLGSVAFYLSLQQAGAQLSLPLNSRPSLAIALGGLGTNLESLVRLFSALDNQGVTQKPRYTDDAPEIKQPLLSSGSAWIIRKILADAPNAPHGIALKTGTSYGFRDSWAIGIVNGYTIGVWVGQPDGTPLTGHYGRQTAVPLLVNIASRVLTKNAMPEQPSTVSQSLICWPSGRKESSPLCDEEKKAWILNKNVPATWMTTNEQNTTLLSSRQIFRIAPDSQQQVPFGCDIEALKTTRMLWPPPLQLWLPEQFRNEIRIPGFDARCAKHFTGNSRLPLKIDGIEKGDAIIADEGQQLKLELHAQGGQAPYYWYVNGKIQDSTSARLIINPQGEYRYDIVLMDYHGQIDRKQIDAYLPPG